MAKKKSPKKLTRGSDPKISGVCSGIAQYFDLDPTLVRVGWIILALLTYIIPSILAYFLIAWVLPEGK